MIQEQKNIDQELNQKQSKKALLFCLKKIKWIQQLFINSWTVYPFFEPFSNFLIYTFGLTLTICFFLALWMMKKLSPRYAIESSIFTSNILWYFFSIFIFSRLFYILWKWNDIKYIQNPFDFFITSDYNFSLVWAIVWFVIVLLIHIKSRKENIDKYIDPLVITFVFIVFIGFIWWFLGGQVYGRETQFGIEILYTHSFTPVPYQVPIFPLPLIYAGLYFLLFCLLYIGSMYVHLRWVLGYFGLIIFSCILLIFEFFSGKYDIFYNTFNINMTQIFSILLIIVCIYRLFLIMKKNEGKDITILHKN